VDQSRRKEAESPDTDALDGALDTLGCVFRTMRDVSFPLDLEGDTHEFATACDQFACHVEHGGAVPLYDIPQAADGDRQWARMRRFYVDRRREEKAFVTERLQGYRGVVGDLVNGLRQIGQRDRETETSVKQSLDAIETALATGILPEIKAALTETIDAIGETFALQKKIYEEKINELNERMSGLRQDLVAVREEMKRDPLTDVYNRRGFDTAIAQSLNMRFILSQPFTLVMIDLDGFKKINDTYGHAAGDVVLRAVGDALARSFTRKNDLIARYGGDEFAVILSDTSLENCKQLIGRLIQYVGAITVPNAPHDVHPGCSVGFTDIAADDTVETLVNRADRVLYEAKAEGGNLFRYAPPPLGDGG
jgi:diguanylate cyclase (GGDEF)-like protein